MPITQSWIMQRMIKGRLARQGAARPVEGCGGSTACWTALVGLIIVGNRIPSLLLLFCPESADSQSTPVFVALKVIP